MKYFNVYYFCHLANESMGKFEYASTNAEFTEQQFQIEPEEFPRISVLREYCSWLVDRVFYEQASLISNDQAYDFNPISWINQAITKYKQIVISTENEFKFDEDDYLETYNNYLEYINKYEDGLFYSVIYDIATEVEYTEILRQYFINHPQSIDKYTFLQNSAFTHWVKEKCSKMC